tara:strand:- start:7461 stop:7763 length:303 start_codon:yes stop_codon:yes gene_type:complete
MSIYKTRNNRHYLEDRKFNFVGMAVAGLQQINRSLHALAVTGIIETSLDEYLNSTINDKSDPADVYKHIKPYGVYNNRGTHDGQDKFAAITNSNVGDSRC